jgi:hypothetical protein
MQSILIINAISSTLVGATLLALMLRRSRIARHEPTPRLLLLTRENSSARGG